MCMRAHIQTVTGVNVASRGMVLRIGLLPLLQPCLLDIPLLVDLPMMVIKPHGCRQGVLSLFLVGLQRTDDLSACMAKDSVPLVIPRSLTLVVPPSTLLSRKPWTAPIGAGVDALPGALEVSDQSDVRGRSAPCSGSTPR